MAKRQSALLSSLEETEQALAAVQAGFQETVDEDLLEYDLYSRCALRSRHNYLLRQLRQTEGAL